MCTYIGVDWASKGWLAVATDGNDWSAEMHPSMHSVWFANRDADSILVDIPIGLPESKRRECDEEAKEFVGTDRANTVFWTPCRDAVEADTYEKAKEANQECRDESLSSQAWGLIPRIQEVDRLLRDDDRAREVILESHPEVCFAALHPDGTLPSKHDETGAEKRLAVLEAVDDSLPDEYEDLVSTHITERAAWKRRIGNSNRDDLLDAMVLALTAKLGADRFDTLPNNPPTDAKSLLMQIVYASR